MYRSLKFIAALSISTLVFAAPTRAEVPAGDGTDKPKQEGERKRKPPGEGGEKGQRNPGERLNRIMDELNFTPEQRTQAQPIIQATREEIQKVMQDQSIERDAKRAKVREIAQAGIAKLAEIATPEQKEKLKSLQEERRKREGGPRDGDKKGPRDNGGDKPEGDKK